MAWDSNAPLWHIHQGGEHVGSVRGPTSADEAVRQYKGNMATQMQLQQKFGIAPRQGEISAVQVGAKGGHFHVSKSGAKVYDK